MADTRDLFKDKTKLRAAFGPEERDRIRAALNAYMEEHRIRVPLLAKRMNYELTQRGQPNVISLSTLQRFLAGTKISSNNFVALSQTFLQRVEARPPNALGTLGEALVLFYSIAGVGYDRAVHAQQIGREVPGRYLTRIIRGLAPMPSDEDRDPSRFSIVDLSHEAGCGYLRVKEDVVNPRWEIASEPGIHPDAHQYDGVYLPFERSGVFILSNKLTRLPKLCLCNPYPHYAETGMDTPYGLTGYGGSLFVQVFRRKTLTFLNLTFYDGTEL